MEEKRDGGGMMMMQEWTKKYQQTKEQKKVSPISFAVEDIIIYYQYDIDVQQRGGREK